MTLLNIVAYLSLAIFFYFISYLFVGAYLRYALKRSILDTPCERSSHHVATPTGAGIAISVFFCLIFTAGLPYIENNISPWAISLIFVNAVISYVDDMYSISALIRLSWQIVMSLLLVFIGNTQWEFNTIGMNILWVIWFIYCVNAYNFMDGIDGIAGSIALIAGAAYAVLGILLSSTFLSIAGIFLFSGCLGFLKYNWHPARIFLGDSGSTFLGIIIPLMDLYIWHHAPKYCGLSLAILYPFSFDVIFTLIKRMLSGEKLYKAHRQHIYQILTQSSFNHASASLLYASLSIACLIGFCLSIWFNSLSLLCIPILLVPLVLLRLINKSKSDILVMNNT